MGRRTWAGGLAAAVIAWGAAAYADVPIVKTDDTTVKIGAMTQVVGYGELLDDPFENDARIYLFMKEARFRLSGERDWFGMNLELSLGPEDRVAAPSPGIALGMLDLYADAKLGAARTAFIRVGQFKVPYSREYLTYSGDSLFSHRSINNLAFLVGRDVGIAGVANPEGFTGILAIMTGGGRDVPLRFLPERIAIPLLVGRVGIGNIKEDPFRLAAGARGTETMEWGLFANAFFTRDSFIGHSTVLNVKTADKSMLTNANWNPFIGRRPLDQGKWWQVGGDGIVRVPMGGEMAVEAQAQVDYGNFSNRYGDISLYGGRAQASLAIGAVDVAARYAILFTDEDLRSGATSITNDETMHEITPALGLRMGDNMRLVADLPIWLNTPVIIEEGVGAYVAVEQPDQTALLAEEARVDSQTVFEGRLMFQAQF